MESDKENDDIDLPDIPVPTWISQRQKTKLKKQKQERHEGYDENGQSTVASGLVESRRVWGLPSEAPCIVLNDDDELPDLCINGEDSDVEIIEDAISSGYCTEGPSEVSAKLDNTDEVEVVSILERVALPDIQILNEIGRSQPVNKHLPSNETGIEVVATASKKTLTRKHQVPLQKNKRILKEPHSVESYKRKLEEPFLPPLKRRRNGGLRAQRGMASFFRYLGGLSQLVLGRDDFFQKVRCPMHNEMSIGSALCELCSWPVSLELAFTNLDIQKRMYKLCSRSDKKIRELMEAPFSLSVEDREWLYISSMGNSKWMQVITFCFCFEFLLCVEGRRVFSEMMQEKNN